MLTKKVNKNEFVPLFFWYFNIWVIPVLHFIILCFISDSIEQRIMMRLFLTDGADLILLTWPFYISAQYLQTNNTINAANYDTHDTKLVFSVCRYIYNNCWPAAPDSYKPTTDWGCKLQQLVFTFPHPTQQYTQRAQCFHCWVGLW